MIEVRNLTKRYGAERAVNQISFTVRQGEVLGFLGPNGAGKSTTMKVVTGFLPPSEGTVLVDGHDVRNDSLAVRRLIGYLPESTPLYRDMTTHDYLRFVAEMRGIEDAAVETRIADMTVMCDLGGVLGKRIEALSKGYRQRVGLAQALIHDPPILILDEPTSGLDPNQIVEIRELIRDIGRQKTVVLSTHILSEVQASCDRVLIINKGKLVADGTPGDLQSQFAGGQRLTLALQNAPAADEVSRALTAIEGLTLDETAAANGSTETVYRLSVRHDRDIRPALFQLAVNRGWSLVELHREKVSLEDVFRQLTA